MPDAIRRTTLAAMVAFAAVARTAGAQLPAHRWLTHLGVGAGLQTSGREFTSPFGLHFAAGLTRHVRASIGVRAEVLVTSFGAWNHDVTTIGDAPCPPGATCGPSGPRASGADAGRMRVEGFTIAVIARRRGDGFASLGAGLYHFDQHPLSSGRTFGGLNAGLSHVISAVRPGFALDAQLHWIPAADNLGRWIAPFRLVLTY